MLRRNFGKNILLTPKVTYSPTCEQEVLEILDRHRGQRIRVIGASNAQMVMEHELFCHIEIELFDPRSKLDAAYSEIAGPTYCSTV